MSYCLKRFQRWHLAVLESAGLPAGGFNAPDAEMARYLEQSPNVVTMFEDELPVGCGGTVVLWPGRHMAWAYLGMVSGPHMLAITRDAYDRVRFPSGRVEMTVRQDFPLGHRWARMLGFRVETPVLEAYGPQGEDHVGYVLLNR